MYGFDTGVSRLRSKAPHIMNLGLRKPWALSDKDLYDLIIILVKYVKDHILICTSK